MDVHRSRFVPYPTSAISALAFSRTCDGGYNDPLPEIKLAIGRANGDIEIWNPQQGSWVQESIFPGDGQSIDAVLWTQDVDEKAADGTMTLGQHRLFSTSSSPAIAEWDLATGAVKRRSTGNFSEVWCFAAQPRTPSSAQDIAAGCGDGNLVLLSTEDDDLQFKRTLARVSGKNARCMCITYQTRERVVAGFADSMIRVYDTRNGSLLRNMSLGVGRPGAPKTALVWQVKCLPGGDIASGDSNGELRIWDGKAYSLSQRLAGHDSDLLDLAVSNDGQQIFSGSIDGKIAVYRHSVDGGRSVWVKNSHRKLHGGEVKAMAAFEGKNMSVLVTGGGDVAPVVTPLQRYGKENVRFLPSLPHRPSLVSASRARLVVSWWDKTISIWRVARQTQLNEPPERQRPRKLVARVHVESKHRLQAVVISPDGRLLAAACSDSIKVFQLRSKPGHDSLVIRRLEIPADLLNAGARLLEFSGDGKWLVAGSPDNETYIARFVQHPTNPKQIQMLQSVVELDRMRRENAADSAFRNYNRSLTRAEFSTDSRMLVLCDRSGYLDSWILQGDEDLSAPVVGVARNVDNSDSESGSDSDSSDDADADTAFYGQRWVENRAASLLPKLDSMPLVLTFRPNAGIPKGSLPHSNINATTVNEDGPQPTQHRTEYRLWILTATHSMYEFDMMAGKLSDWSRRNPTLSLPTEFTKIRDRVKGALWDVSEEYERLWLYGTSYVCMLDIGQDLNDSAQLRMPKKRHHEKKATSNAEIRKRRKLESGAGGRVTYPHDQGIEDIGKKYRDGERPKLLASNGVEDAVPSGDESDYEAVNLPLVRVNNSGEDRIDGADGGTIHHRKWWCSHRYSPILGIVPVHDDSEDASSQPLEVVLVERPVEVS